MVLGPPKSRAGRRTVALPAPVVAVLREHLATFGGEGPDGLVFPGQRGGVLRRSNFNRATNWREAVAAVGEPSLHLHDLRHTGNTLAAATGASLRDLMARIVTTASERR
jgi:integrase